MKIDEKYMGKRYYYRETSIDSIITDLEEEIKRYKEEEIIFKNDKNIDVKWRNGLYYGLNMAITKLKAYRLYMREVKGIGS